MKKILMVGLLFFAVVPSWAKIGRHNLLLSFNAGAGIYYNKNMNSNSLYSLGGVGRTQAKALLGFDIGYLLHSVRESGTVHGMDLRLGVLGELPTTGYSGTLGSHDSFFGLQPLQNFTFRNPMLLILSLGYTPGRQFGSFRLMFDVIGASFSLAFASVTSVDTGEKYVGVLLATQITLPLGLHFILNNGAYVAVRHFIVVNPYSQSAREPVTKYALMFSLGYAFGK